MNDSRARFSKVTELALIAVFLLGMLIPALDHRWHFIQVKELDENRKRAELPEVPTTWEATREFPHKFDAWWSDAFGGRSALIRLNARQKLAMGISSSDKVVVGDGSWLFFTGESSLDIYRGMQPMSDADLLAWKRELEARRDWLASQGIAYVFMVCPNKETIYGDAMPARYTKRGPTRLEQLADYLKANSNVEFIDLREALSAERQKQRVYMYTDTHWNDFGAFLGYSELMKRLAKVNPGFVARKAEDFTPRKASAWYGDLAQMLGMNEMLEEERSELVPKTPYLAQPMPNAPNSPQAHVMQGPAGKPRAVVFHDSFLLPPEERGDPARAATAAKLDGQSPLRLVPLLAEQFSYSVFVWTHAFDPNLVITQKPNVVIQEMVERGLRNPPQGHAPVGQAINGGP